MPLSHDLFSTRTWTDSVAPQPYVREKQQVGGQLVPSLHTGTVH